jgi:hypothetical protein
VLQHGRPSEGRTLFLLAVLAAAANAAAPAAAAFLLLATGPVVFFADVDVAGAVVVDHKVACSSFVFSCVWAT